jgi:DNA invertase Pin-like site-specific DNA recombinase
MAIVGYARVSTGDQDLEVQIQQLKDAHCDKIFTEKASGAQTDRPVLAETLRYIREGDIVVICKLDRIARSTKHLLDILEMLEGKKVTFRVLNINLDTATATGKLMMTMLGAIATFERDMMLERQREGIRLAKNKGMYKGRKPTALAKSDRVFELLAQGKGKKAIAKELGIGIASVYRIAPAGQNQAAA